MITDTPYTCEFLYALARMNDQSSMGSYSGITHGAALCHSVPSSVMAQSRDAARKSHMLRPCAPFFYYRDYSALPDPNPNVPVTAPGRMAHFPAKMFAILIRPELAHIVSWMPHGRSWKVHKPREFEVKILPVYFEHVNYSSFVRQANGWGFRRMISKGPDRNSYYHEMFLRGLPHLLKNMKRPPPNSKPLLDARTEPDFYRISEICPLPDVMNGALLDNLKQQPNSAEVAHLAHVENKPNPFDSTLQSDDSKPLQSQVSLTPQAFLSENKGFNVSALQPSESFLLQRPLSLLPPGPVVVWIINS